MNYEMLPIITFKKLWHVGTMNPDDKGVRGPSHEGGGLSVSLHPESWIRIAKLGGQPTWTLTKSNGGLGRFVNWRRLSLDEQRVVAEYAEAAGYLCVEPRFEVTWYDLDDDSHNFIVYKTLEEAQAECESLQAQEYIEFPAVKELKAHVSTRKLDTAVGHAVNDLNCVAVALSVLLETVEVIDGVWWDERHDVAGLSAPRGMLTRNALANWKCIKRGSPD